MTARSGGHGSEVGERPSGTIEPTGRRVETTLSGPERDELAKIAVTLDYAGPDLVICQEDEAANFVYALHSGVVRISSTLPQGKRQVIAFMWPGDAFGLSEQGRYTSTAETVTKVRVRRYSRKDLERVLLDDSQLSFRMMIKAAQKLRETQRRVVCLGQLKVPARLARFLIDITAEPGLFNAADSTLHLPMSRADIADYLGTSVETVARVLTRMEGEGLLVRQGAKTLQLIDFPSLTKMATSNEG